MKRMDDEEAKLILDYLQVERDGICDLINVLANSLDSKTAYADDSPVASSPSQP